MKLLLTLLIPFIFWGCGIIELLFPAEFPQRYITREVNQSELVGTWKITPDSIIRVNDYFQQEDAKFWSIDSPWESISLYENGSCEVGLEVSWSATNDVLKEPDAPATCTWKTDTILGYDKNGSLKNVPGVFVRFEHHDKEADTYNILYSELYIVEENNELLLWDFIGDATLLSYQDFKKVEINQN